MEIMKLKRSGWDMECPFCHANIRYTLINNQQPPVPFFYAELCNDVLLRKSDERMVNNLLSIASGEKASINTLENMWLSILQDAPDAPHGGKFGFWSNIKCPHCGKEIQYNQGIKDVWLRIFEPKIVLVDGSVIVGDSLSDTWQIQVQT